MKMIRISITSNLLCVAMLMALASCSNKQSADQPSDLTDLNNFPKEWVLADDIAPPDSITRNYIIPVDSSNSFLGGITIKQNGSDWQMTTSGFFYPGTYVIKSCKRVNEGEMVYYDFDLRSAQDTTKLKFSVNFRHGEGIAPQTSVFTCTTCEGHPDVQLVDKEKVNDFPKKSLSELQYD
jgi:hypothetical protein